MKHQFNIRVYCILQHNKQFLVLEEPFANQLVFKLPGGGLEFGEGTLDCLQRELKEELNLEIKQINHFYTQDFFLESRFNQKEQILMIYYTAKVVDINAFRIVDANIKSAVWKNIATFDYKTLSLPTDQMVVQAFAKSSFFLESTE